jgi:hypothetical protein
MHSHSFEDGAVIGGPVLWKEPDEEFARRQKNLKMAWILLSLTLIFCIAFPYVLKLVFKVKLLPRVAEASVILSVCVIIIPLYISFYRLTPKTRLTVYKNGVSLGYGKRPFFLFSDLHYVEEYIVPNFKESETFFIELTSSNGEFHVSQESLRNKDVHRTFVDAMTRRFSGLKKAMPWTKDAKDLISSMTGPRGPIHYAIEQLALRQHLVEINLDFIRMNWQQIAKGRRHSFEFKKMATKRWGKLVCIPENEGQN